MVLQNPERTQMLVLIWYVRKNPIRNSPLTDMVRCFSVSYKKSSYIPNLKKYKVKGCVELISIEVLGNFSKLWILAFKLSKCEALFGFEKGWYNTKISGFWEGLNFVFYIQVKIFENWFYCCFPFSDTDIYGQKIGKLWDSKRFESKVIITYNDNTPSVYVFTLKEQVVITLQLVH